MNLKTRVFKATIAFCGCICKSAIYQKAFTNLENEKKKIDAEIKDN